MPGLVMRTGRTMKREAMVMSFPVATWLRFFAALVLALSLAACANKDLDPEAGLAGKGMGPATPGSQRDFAQNVGDIVYFSTDQVDLTPEAQQTLVNQARWLNQYSQYTITIEGHADERGTREYNIALGARRATNVRDFLVRNGVSAQRLRTISYGKERPVAVCNDISCWSQNRRAQTVLNNRSVEGPATARRS
jgi:peptidoglycan-associated lipoprotein